MAKIEDIVVENLDAFLGFARKRLDSQDLAADAVQESLLKALKAASPPEADEKLVAWFYQILRRTIIDIYRERAVNTKAIAKLQDELPEQATTDDEAIICGCFRSLIPTLPRGYGELLRRIDLEGGEPKQVAAELGVTWNNLNVRLHRARGALRDRLEVACRACSKHGCLDCTCKGNPNAA